MRSRRRMRRRKKNFHLFCASSDGKCFSSLDGFRLEIRNEMGRRWMLRRAHVNIMMMSRIEWVRVELRSFIFRSVWHELKILHPLNPTSVRWLKCVLCVCWVAFTFSLCLLHIHIKWWSVGHLRRRWMMRILTDLCSRCSTHKFQLSPEDLCKHLFFYVRRMMTTTRKINEIIYPKINIEKNTRQARVMIF